MVGSCVAVAVVQTTYATVSTSILMRGRCIVRPPLFDVLTGERNTARLRNSSGLLLPLAPAGHGAYIR